MRDGAVVVRDAERGDLLPLSRVRSETVTALRRVYRPASGPAEEHAASAARAHHATLGPGQLLVALVDGSVVGTVEYFDEDDGLYLRNLGVLAPFQRRGVARRLVETVAARATAQAVPRLSLETIAETGNVPIFERLGFCVVGLERTPRFVDTQRGAVTLVRMERRVDAAQSASGRLAG